VSANSACFERELPDHHRLVFEKTDKPRAGVECPTPSSPSGPRSPGNAPWDARGRRKARELPPSGVHVEMRVPVTPGGVKRIVYALPRGALRFLKRDAHVPALVADQRSST
jgi:hypothetical protein